MLRARPFPTSTGDRFRCLRNLLLVLALASPATAMADGGPSSDSGAIQLADFARFKDVTAAQTSPDGKSIAYVVSVTDLPANRVKTELWIVPAGEGEPKQLAVEAESIDVALWSPQGDVLAVAGATGKPAENWLWLVDPGTGKGQRLTRLEKSNHYLAHRGASLCWSPDGASLAYLAAEADSRPPDDGPRVVSRIQYKARKGFSDLRPTHVWVVPASGGKPRQVTKGQYDEHSIDWSPRGDEIVCCSNREPDPDANLNYDLFAIKVVDGTKRRLTRTAACEMSPVWAPDGRSIAYLMTRRNVTTIDSVAEDAHVWVLDLETGRARELTDRLDRRCTHPHWSPDGKTVYFMARDHGKNLIFRVPAAGGAAVPLFDVAGTVSTFSLPPRSGRMACVLSTPTQPAEVWTCNSDGSDRLARTRVNVAARARWKMVEPVEVNFKSFDGTPVQGWLMMPPGATVDAKVPLVLVIHGGPHSMHGCAFSTTLQLYCARGYAVLYLNPRGSAGYGQRFSDGCVNDWGGADYKDLIASVDHVLARFPAVDAERLGLTGGSYGGYMTNWMITQDSRFKAAVSYAGLSNLISFYATSLYQDLIHVEFNGPAWDHYEILWQRSPLRYVQRARTPTLILHGEADNDVHVTQSEELYTALKRRGVETVFVRYPREGHGATEPRHQLDQLERTVAWFDRFLKPGGTGKK